MSSGTRYDPSSVRKLIDGLASRLMVGGQRVESVTQAMQKISRLGMSPRQMALNRLWACYRCEQYAARRIDWNGAPVMDPIEHEAVAHSTSIPPGFYDAGESMPIKFRRPTAPYALTKVIVDRFTGLLFSERHHPQIRVDGDELTEDYVGALVEAGRLWPAMIQARTYGGAMGTVAIGFQFVDGRLEFEVHDPRWCKPRFADKARLELQSIEKRYMYPEEEVDEATGQYEIVWYWYRRVIDVEGDVVFQPVEVGDGSEPKWVPDKVVQHDFGFCPVVWMQNLPVQDDTDGDPDAHGVYDLVEAIDALYSQANRGTLANSDPTLVISTDDDMSDVRKGSDNAIKLSSGSSAVYLELQGVGQKAALELAHEFRKLALEVAQAVLDHPDVANRTATEIDRVYSAMIAKADVMREQYGEKGIKPLLEKVLVAVHLVTTTGREDGETGEVVYGEVRLPPRKTIDEVTGLITYVERELGESPGVLQVQWPRYFESMLTDVELATRSAIAAKAGGLIDQKHAVEYVAEHFKVEDTQGMIRQIDEERSEEEERMAAQALGMLRTPGVPAAEGAE